MAALSTFAASAQITIGAADMPSAGDTVRFVGTTVDGIDPAATEAGFLWDMGALVPDLEGADTCIAVGATPLLYQLYFNNPFIYPQWVANYAVRGQSFDFQGQLTVDNVYEYFKKDDTGFRNVGFGANVNGVPASVRRIPVDWIHRFPMTYGDMDTSYSEFTLAVPSLFSFTQQQTRYNEVDGWGTLYLPADTFEVLRVKSTLLRDDSVYIEQFGQGFAFPEPETIEYKWIAQGMDEPVLLIVTTGGQVTTARMYYHLEDITTGLPAGPPNEVFGAFPNPVSESLTFNVPAEAGTIVVRDAAGRIVRSQRVGGSSSITGMWVGDLASGLYSAVFRSSSRTLSTRVAIDR